MIRFKSSPVELRGATLKKSKNGNSYVLINIEDENGEHYQFFSADEYILQNGFNKGDLVHLVCEFSLYNREVRLSVVEMIKA